MFAEMSDREFWQNLSDCLDYVSYQRGDVLFHAGDMGDRMYILLKGEAILYFRKEAADYKTDDLKRVALKL